MTATALRIEGLESDLVSHLPYLRSLALHLCGRPDEAADLVQEAMERGLRWARTLPAGSNVRAWLRRVLWNLFIDRWRRQAREALEAVADLDAIPANDDQPEPQPRWAAIDDDRLQAAVASLPSAFRTVYQLHAQGHDYRAISRRLGLPAATVGTRLHRARKKLRTALERGQRRAAESA
ncbi:MAG TPA: RNA polymerase sigma factor [Myxococcales bacterium]|nr:RNA polymerase sigma factor [Myxococcales bacterium]